MPEVSLEHLGLVMCLRVGTGPGLFENSDSNGADISTPNMNIGVDIDAKGNSNGGRAERGKGRDDGAEGRGDATTARYGGDDGRLLAQTHTRARGHASTRANVLGNICMPRRAAG